MSDFGSPVVRRQRLAAELRRLRQNARLTGKEVVPRLGWSEAKLSRIERGLTTIKISDIVELMDLYGVTDPHRAELLALAEESRESGPIEQLRGDLPEGHTDFLRAESEAQAMWIWEPQVEPGLLQIGDYTRALLQLWPATFARPAEEIERRVETSRLRQRILQSTPQLDLSVVIDESVLHRKFGDSATMHNQLSHLAEMSEHPNIDLRVLALSGHQVIGTGAFVCFKFPRVHGVALADTVALEHLHGTTFVTAEAEVNTYEVVFRTLVRSSLDPQASRDLLRRVGREMWRLTSHTG